MSTPSLVLDYARTKALLGIETFSRNRPATYVGPDGKYRLAPRNAHRPKSILHNARHLPRSRSPILDDGADGGKG